MVNATESSRNHGDNPHNTDKVTYPLALLLVLLLVLFLVLLLVLLLALALGGGVCITITATRRVARLVYPVGDS